MEDTLGKIKRYVGESHYLDTVLILATLVHLEGHKLLQVFKWQLFLPSQILITKI